MTREDLVKKRWQGYEIINYTRVNRDEPIEYMLISIDFDNELFQLEPMDKETY